MDEKSNIVEMEIIISKFLRAGVLLSATVIFTGFSLFLITGKSGYPENYYPASPIEIFSGLIELKSYAIILSGLILLILTPVFRVGVSILVFIKEKDKLYIRIATSVFIILIISFILGKVE